MKKLINFKKHPVTSLIVVMLIGIVIFYGTLIVIGILFPHPHG